MPEQTEPAKLKQQFSRTIEEPKVYDEIAGVLLRDKRRREREQGKG